jgi:hypothetical protein
MIKVATLLLLLLSMVIAGCGPDQRIIDSAKERDAAENGNSNVAPSVSSFEKDLQAMRNADFKFIVVFRRKDGTPLDAEDKAAVVKFAGQANRRSLSDEGKAIIIGSNFAFAPGDLQGLNERFTMENHSKPDSGPMISNTSPAATNANNERRER